MNLNWVKWAEWPGVRHLFCWWGPQEAERLWNWLEQQLRDLADGFLTAMEVAAPLEMRFCGAALGVAVGSSA